MHLRDLVSSQQTACHPPPIFTLPRDHPLWTRGPRYDVWERAGYESGTACWQAMCEGIGEERERPLISWDLWDELLRSELIRRACYAETLTTRRGRDRTPIDWQRQLAADLKLCREDPHHWLDHWAWIEDTHADDPEMRDAPLLTWPSQRALWSHLDDLYDQATAREPVAEIWCKGRRLGVTWLVMAWGVRRWLLEQMFSLKVGSRVFREADRGEDTESMMGKVRFLLARQPEHLRPDYPGRVSSRAKPIKDIAGFALNGWTRAKVSAEHTTGNFGRSGRAQVVILDEFARIKARDQEEARTSMRTVSKVEIILSTPQGSTNRFAWEWRRRPDHSKLELPWPYDPRRDLDWRRSELLDAGGTLTEAEARQEHDCSLQGISSEHIWALADDLCLYDDSDPDWEDLGDPRGRLPQVGGMDFGTGPSLTTYCHWIVDWDAGIETALGRLPRLWLDLSIDWRRTPEHEIARDILDAQDAYAGSWAVYGDPAGAATGVEQRSSMGQIQAGGVPVVKSHAEMVGWDGKSQRIEHLQEMARLGLIRVHRTRAAGAWAALTGWRWHVPPGCRIQQLSRDTIVPRKDDYSHTAEAALYGLDGILRWHQPQAQSKTPPKRQRRQRKTGVDAALRHWA